MTGRLPVRAVAAHQKPDQPSVTTPDNVRSLQPDMHEESSVEHKVDESWRWIRWRPTDPEAPRRGGGYDINTTYELVNSENSHLADYNKLFPQRLSYQACGRIQQSVNIFPWIYSLIEGSFTAAHERQKMYRTAYVKCPASKGDRFTHEILIADGSKTVARFEVPDQMYLGYQYDVDHDGVTEAIVEWHSRLTPALMEGRIGIVSVKAGAYREFYRGRWEVKGTCPRIGAKYHEIALGVRLRSAIELEVLEEEWQVGCDPNSVTREVGDWQMTQSQTTIVDLASTEATH